MRQARERHGNQQREQQHRPEVAEPEQNYDNNARKHSVPPPGAISIASKHSQYVHYSGRSDKSRAIISRGARYVWPGGFEEVREIVEDT